MSEDSGHAAARSVAYQMLAALYAYPDVAVARWIFDRQWIEPLRQAAKMLKAPKLRACADAFENALKDPRDEATLALAREHTRLFINGFPCVVAPPYGSVYLDAEGLTYGPSTVEVVSAYAAAGLQASDDVDDLPDRITAELEFMALLAEREADEYEGEVDRWKTMQRDFFNRLLNPWILPFASKIIGKTTLSFYKVLAEATLYFIEQETALFRGPAGVANSATNPVRTRTISQEGG